MNHTNKSIKLLNDEVLNLNKELVATDNYIEKYLPFKTLSYIHDIAKETFPLRLYGKVISYLHDIYP